MTDTGYNCLHLAASAGHTTICQRLVDAGSPLDEITEAGLYGAALHYAAGKGHLSIVNLLLEAGANKDTLSEDNCTPLYYAVLGNHWQLSSIYVNRYLLSKANTMK